MVLLHLKVYTADTQVHTQDTVKIKKYVKYTEKVAKGVLLL